MVGRCGWRVWDVDEWGIGMVDMWFEKAMILLLFILGDSQPGVVGGRLIVRGHHFCTGLTNHPYLSPLFSYKETSINGVSIIY